MSVYELNNHTTHTVIRMNFYSEHELISYLKAQCVDIKTATACLPSLYKHVTYKKLNIQ